MKRFRLWLLLPVLLGVLAWGLKWKADNPSSTKEDLEFRAMMMKPSKVEYSHSSGINRFKPYSLSLSTKELDSFASSLHVLPSNDEDVPIGQTSFPPIGENGMIQIYQTFDVEDKDNTDSILTHIHIDSNWGQITTSNESGIDIHNLHPTTRKRWLELLLNHPRIGPELRRRMK